MSSMLKDEITILKAVSIKVNDDVVLLATYQYHTEENEFGKNDRSKSFYRWYARVDSIENYKKLIAEWTSDEHRLEKNSWPNDNLPYRILVNKGVDKYSLAKFFATKLKKAVDWETGIKLLNGYKHKTAKSEAHYHAGANYEIEGYDAEDGTKVNLDDKEALLRHIGQNLYHPAILKSHLPRTTKPVEKAVA